MALKKDPDLILEEAIDEFEPDHIFPMFSGGHDSLVTTHLVQEHELVEGVVHINTQIGIEETRNFVEHVSEDFGWNLITISPEDAIEAGYKGWTYREFFYRWGFPGGAQHGRAYQWLKERPLRMLNRWYEGDVMLVTGVRADESDRRMGNVTEYHEQNGYYWCSPIVYFDSCEKNQYMSENDLPRNPVHDKLHMSGECLCGAMGGRDEREQLKFWGFEVLEEIKEIERQIEIMNEFRLECMYRPKGQPRPARWNWKNEKDPDQQDLLMCTDCGPRSSEVSESE